MSNEAHYPEKAFVVLVVVVFFFFFWWPWICRRIVFQRERGQQFEKRCLFLLRQLDPGSQLRVRFNTAVVVNSGGGCWNDRDWSVNGRGRCCRLDVGWHRTHRRRPTEQDRDIAAG